jgi:hypothetical protein
MDVDTSNTDIHDPIITNLIIKMYLIRTLQPNICQVLSDLQCNVKVFWEASKDVVHIELDGVGLVPVLGEIADLLNGTLYVIEGDGVNATLSYASAVPFFGWAAQGTKYAIKVVNAGGNVVYTVGTKVRLTWKVLENGTIHFGTNNTCRAQLRKVLGLASGNANQAHHIIPLNLQTNPVIQRAARSENAFHMNEALNGIPLSTAVHSGSHGNYDARILQKLNAIPANLTPNQTYDELMNILNQVRTAIANNPTTPINQLNF